MEVRGDVQRRTGRRSRPHAEGDCDQDDREGHRRALVFDDESPAPRIITERDILNAVGTGKDPDVEKVADHMSESVISAEPSWSLEQAAEEMVQRRIRHLVVVERGELVGVLSMRDIVRCWTQVGATSSMSPP